MQPPTPQDITAIVLAGGRGRRLGGRDKGLVPLAGRPLVARVLDAIAPQVGGVVISANRHHDDYARFGWPVVADALADFQGPLAGVAAALAAVRTPWAVTVPCDAPWPPADLVARLGRALVQQQGQLAAAHDGRRLQPLHLLLPVALGEDLHGWLARGGRAALGWLDRLRVAVADCADVAGGFANINTEADLAALAAGPPAPLAPAPDGARPPAWPAFPRPVLAFTGWSGSGKTTLLRQVIAELAGRGLRLAAVKHSHHRFDIDRPGKDSYLLRQAGAQQTVVASVRRLAWLHELGEGGDDPSLAEALATLRPQRLDGVLVEGFKHSGVPRIEVWRAATGRPLAVGDDDPRVLAVASDAPLPPGLFLPRLDIDDPGAVADFVARWLAGGGGRP